MKAKFKANATLRLTMENVCTEKRECSKNQIKTERRKMWMISHQEYIRIYTMKNWFHLSRTQQTSAAMPSIYISWIRTPIECDNKQTENGRG